MSHEQYGKKYVIAELPDDANQSDTKIRIKLFAVPTPQKAPPPKEEDSLSQSSLSEEEQEEGEIVSVAQGSHNMNIEEDSSEYEEDTPSKNVEHIEPMAPSASAAAANFWAMRSDRQKGEQQSRELVGNPSQLPMLPEETMLAFAMEAARRTNDRVLSNRREIKQLLQTHQKPAQNYLNSSNTHFKANEYPVLLQDQRGRTFYSSNNNSFVVQQSSIQSFIQRNLTDQTSYLQEVAKYGNFAQQHTRKRRKHHFQ